MTLLLDKLGQAVPKRRQKRGSYNENLDEPASLIAEEPTDVEEDTPAEENEPIEEAEQTDTAIPRPFEE